MTDRGKIAGNACPSAEQGRRHGFALIESLVTLLLVSVGLIGLAGLQARTVAAQMESYQRVQALLLAQDMADRIAVNKAQAIQYVADDYGSGPAVACAGLAGYQRDACDWGNALRGIGERKGGLNAGTLLQGRGCVTAPGANRYLVIVVWQGLLATAQPAVACGAGSYGPETHRRAIVVPVQLADLAGA